MHTVTLAWVLACCLAAQSAEPEREFRDAVAAQDRGDFQAAERQYRSLLTAHPEALPVRVNLASVLIARNNFKDAVTVLLPAEATHRNNGDVTWLLGLSLVNSGRLLEGLRRVEQVGAHGNADACLLAAETRLKLDQYDDALKQVNAALNLNAALPQAHTVKGMILEHSGDYAHSVVELDAALKADPDDARAHLYLGAVLLYERQLDPARGHLEQAVRLDPASPLALYQLAIEKLAQGDTAGAANDLEEVERRSPQWIQPHIELAALYYRLQRPRDGLRERKLVDQIGLSPKSQPLIAPAP